MRSKSSSVTSSGGGVCVDEIGTFSCDCYLDFSGTGIKNCVKIDDCLIDNDCSPGGICVDDIETYHCECDAPVAELVSGSTAKSCRFTYRGENIYDAVTNLTWSSGYGAIDKINDSPEEYCRRVFDNARAPTVAEVSAVIDLLWLRRSGCLGAAGGTEICGPGDISDPETFCVHCIL